MGFKVMGIFFGCVVVICFAIPVWGQDAPQSSGKSSEQSYTDKETASTVTIEDAMICQDVVNRAPVGSGDVFAKEVNKLYCYCRVLDAPPDSQITHNWYYNGSLKASVNLNVRSSNYRTRSSKTILPQWGGEWMVEILSNDGKPLKSIVFTVQ